MRPITREEVVARSVATLGFDPEYVDLDTPEVVVDIVRWSASQRCPLTRAALRRIVVEHVGPLTTSMSDFRDSVDHAVEALLATSDLIEQSDDDGADRIYLGPPRYVRLGAGRLALLGVRPGGIPLVSSPLDELIDHRGSVRYLAPASHGWETDTVVRLLEDAGFIEVQVEEWIKAPPRTSWMDHLSTIGARLDQAVSAVSLDPATVKVFDPASRQDFYAGRWREARRGDEGMVIARRPQAYGAHRWSVLRLVNGAFTTGFDLPTNGTARACDEAWRIMAALDAKAGHPVEMRVASLPGDRRRLDFQAPLPNYLERLLSTLGNPIERGRGALLSFAVRRSDVNEVGRLFSESLWGRIGYDEGVAET